MRKVVIVLMASAILSIIGGKAIIAACDFIVEQRAIEDRAAFVMEDIQDI